MFSSTLAAATPVAVSVEETVAAVSAGAAVESVATVVVVVSFFSHIASIRNNRLQAIIIGAEAISK